jgi:membrane-associated protein
VDIFQQFIEWVIHHGGLYILLLIIFSETGLFLGFFLPGDSLLFASGIYLNELSTNFYQVYFPVIIFLVIMASFIGSMLGYWIGQQTGAKIYKWKDGFLYKKKYLIQANEFYKKHGRGTVFLSKFLPVIRTFAPLVSGVVQMPKSVFIFYNLIGSIAWVTTMMVGGRFLQSYLLRMYGFSLKDHIEVITLVIIGITTIPILYKMFIEKVKSKKIK